jgi:hypothetical protein
VLRQSTGFISGLCRREHVTLPTSSQTSVWQIVEGRSVFSVSFDTATVDAVADDLCSIQNRDDTAEVAEEYSARKTPSPSMASTRVIVPLVVSLWR